MCASLVKSRAFIGYLLCQVLALADIFTRGAGPYVVVTQMALRDRTAHG